MVKYELLNVKVLSAIIKYQLFEMDLLQNYRLKALYNFKPLSNQVRMKHSLNKIQKNIVGIIRYI